MSDLWIGDVGIRVTNLEKSIEFYTKVFDLEELDRGGNDEGKYVLFRDKRSAQRIELNWYAENSPFWAPYVPGEALDHFEVRVKSVLETLERLKSLGIHPATKKLWVNRRAIAKLEEDPKCRQNMKEDVWITRGGGRIAYVQDPDGIFFCLYDSSRRILGRADSGWILSDQYRSGDDVRPERSLPVTQDACDRSRGFPAQTIRRAKALVGSRRKRTHFRPFGMTEWRAAGAA